MCLHAHAHAHAARHVARRSVRISPWPQFAEWVPLTIWGADADGSRAGDAQSLEFWYPGPSGARTQIKTYSSLATWLDCMWCFFPLELEVYEKGATRDAADDSVAAAAALYAALDRDGNGHLDLTEVHAATKLCVVQSCCAKQDMSDFFARAFALSDSDQNSKVDRAEFMDVFRRVEPAFTLGLVRRPDFRMRALEADAVASHCWRHSLRDAAAKGGPIRLDANPECDYGISLHVPKACLSAENVDAWIQASTVPEELIDSFEDPAESPIGALCSPLVHVELAAGTTLAEAYELVLPHCLANPQVLEGHAHPLQPTDFLVATATLGGATWECIPVTDIELLPGDAALRQPPAVKVRLAKGGVVGGAHGARDPTRSDARR